MGDERGLGIDMQIGRSAVVPGDRDLLFQAVANLLDNAIKSTPPGGRISLGLWVKNGAAELSVSDTEPGIPAQDRD